MPRGFQAMRSLPIAMIGIIALGGLDAQAADEDPALFPIIQNGKGGYIDRSGKVVIPPKFQMSIEEDARAFQGGREPVRINQEMGYLDPSGAVIIAAQFDLALPFSEGLAAVRVKDGHWGYIDPSGKMVIPPTFKDAYPFSEGLAVASLENTHGYIDKSGAFVVPPQFTGLSEDRCRFSEGLANVVRDGKWGFIDKTGAMVIEPQFHDASSFHEGLAVATAVVGSRTGWGFIDQTGAMVIKPVFSLAWRFSEGLARVRVREGGQMAFIDQTGAIVFSLPGARWAGEFSEGLVKVRLDGPKREERWGYVDRAGAWKIEPRFETAETFHHGLARVMTGGKYAYIDSAGKYVWGPESWNAALETRMATQTSAANYRRYVDEILDLARQIDPAKPPVTAESLRTSGPPVEEIARLAQSGNAPAQRLLRRLVAFVVDPASLEQNPAMTGFAALGQQEVRSSAAKALINLATRSFCPRSGSGSPNGSRRVASRPSLAGTCRRRCTVSPRRATKPRSWRWRICTRRPGSRRATCANRCWRRSSGSARRGRSRSWPRR